MTAPRFGGVVHSSRSLALQVLLDCDEHDVFVQEALDRQLSQHTLSSNERRLATQLVYGVLRRRSTLHALVRLRVHRPAGEVEPWVWHVLHLGAYQLLFLDGIPAHAAIHETVELASRFGRFRTKGFLNAILRSVSRLATGETAGGPAADALPLEKGVYRKLAQGVLPNPEANPVEYFSIAFGLPRWLGRRWYERYSPEECLRLGFWFAGPAPVTLRSNRLRTGRDDLLAGWLAANIQAEPGEHPQAIRLTEGVPIRDLPGYNEGLFCVQDESAMRVASALEPKPGWRVLDLCAAPGGKTTHLAELMNNQGEVIACDTDPDRLDTVRQLARRLGLSIVRTHQVDRGLENLPKGLFDAALVDAPCSNTGVLGRRPEVRWRLKPEDVRELVPLQVRLLVTAARQLKPGGVLVYSTCSIEPEENEEVVTSACHLIPELTKEAEAHAVPGRPADGGYWARLRHTTETH